MKKRAIRKKRERTIQTEKRKRKRKKYITRWFTFREKDNRSHFSSSMTSIFYK